jgi:2-polyprenyl-3-methyl-5-hydroxy-6-metoxy-1,4-benzoquinol methylase
VGVQRLVLLEPSAAMRGNAPRGAAVWTLRAEELHTVEAEFDVITCLWNVLGHIFPSLARTEVLCQFARLVSPRGKVFVDLNHRYNARHYGVLPTALRFARDSLLPRDSNGDVAVAWEVDGARATTTGHVFTDAEFRSMARAAGLTVEKRWVLDYATGETRRWSIEGHMLYALTR